MKSIFLLVLVLAGLCCAKVDIITKSIDVFPEKEIGKIARIVFNTDTQGSFLFVIKDAKGSIVRTLSAAKIGPGQGFVDWDAKDFLGKTVSEGQYTASIVSGISMTLDEKFGKNGRIGLDTIEIKVSEPEKIVFKVPGEIKRISIGEKEYYKTDSFAIAGPNYIIKDGNVQVNPLSGVKKDDIVRVEYYFPFFLENPWAIDIDDSENLYVIYKWKKEGSQSPVASVAKISPDGTKAIDDFGVRGKIGPFSGHTSQIVVNEKEGKIYVSATHDSGHSAGVFSIKTGAFFYAIGGWFEGGKSPKTTAFQSGIVLGQTNKIYIRGFSGFFSAYDRTKEKDTGFLYAENPIKRHSGYAPLIDNYWGPSLESGIQQDCFYTSSYGSDIARIKDTGNGFVELYYISVNGSPVGMSLDEKTGLLFAALRTKAGEIAVLHDSNFSLNELWRLKDNNLGPVHQVKLKGNYLYVVENGFSPAGRILEAMNKEKISPQGKNRISRYKIDYQQENEVCRISVKK